MAEENIKKLNITWYQKFWRVLWTIWHIGETIEELRNDIKYIKDTIDSPEKMLADLRLTKEFYNVERKRINREKEEAIRDKDKEKEQVIKSYQDELSNREMLLDQVIKMAVDWKSKAENFHKENETLLEEIKQLKKKASPPPPPDALLGAFLAQGYLLPGTLSEVLGDRLRHPPSK